MHRQKAIGFTCLVVSILAALLMTAGRACGQSSASDRKDELNRLVSDLNVSMYVTKQQARETLLRMDRPTVIAHLVEMLETNGGVWSNGVIRLFVDMGDDATRPLISVIERRPGIMERWRDALESSPSGTSVPIFFQDEFSAQRISAASALIAIGRPAVPAVIATLKGGSPIARAYAAKILGRIADRRALAPLIEALSDETAAVRWSTAWALGEFKTPRIIVPLTDAFNDIERLVLEARTSPPQPPDPTRAPEPPSAVAGASDITRTIIRALGKHDDPRVLTFLAARLKDADESVRLEALGAIKQRKDPRAEKLLQSALDDDAPAVRAAAVSALKKSDSPEIVELLAAALGDADTGVRQTAALALALRGDRRSVPVLLSMLPGTANDLSSWRGGIDELRAMKSLAEMKEERAVEPLLVVLRSEDSRMRRAAAVALGEIGPPAAFEPLVLALADPESGVRRAAILALEKIDPEKAAGPIATRLKDPDASVVGWAAKALGRIGSPVAVEPLIEALPDFSGKHVTSVIEALGNIGDPRAADILLEALQGWGDHSPLARDAADALKKIKSPDTVEPLIALLGDEDEGVRRSVPGILGEIGTPEVFQPLKDASLKDESAYVRKAAVRGLQAAGGRQAVETIIAALADDDETVADAAQGALREMADPRAIEPLSSILKTGTDDMRVRAAKVLGKIEEPEAVGPLIAALKDPNRDVRARAAWSLEDRGDPRAVAPLLPLLEDGDVKVRQAAVWVLSEYDEKSIVDELVKTLEEDSDVTVRRGAAVGLGNIGDNRAVAPLVAALKDSDVNMRWNAAFSLGRLKDPAAVEPLVAALGRRKSSEIGAIAFALSSIGTERAENVVDSLVNRKEVAAAANYNYLIRKSEKADLVALSVAMVRHGDLKMAEALYWSGYSHLNQAAYWWARQNGLVEKLEASEDSKNRAKWRSPRPTRLSRLIEEFEGGNAEKRANSISRMGYQFMSYAPREGAAMFEDVRPIVIVRIGDALEPPYNEQSAEDFAWDSSVGGDWDQSHAGFANLIRKEISPDEMMAAVELVAAAVDDESARVRNAAVKSLAYTRDPVAIEPLSRAMKDENRNIRRRAAFGLARIRTDEAVDVLIEALGDETLDIRNIVILALGDTKNPKALPIIIERLEDEAEDTAIRSAAAEACGYLADPTVITPLRTHLEHDDPLLRAASASALGQMSDEGSINAISNLLYDEEVRVIVSAAQALVAIGTPAASRALDDACGDLGLEGVVENYAQVIRGGDEEDIPSLIIALTVRSAYTSRAIGDYYWSGREELLKAAMAQVTISEKSFRVDHPDGPKRPRWGSMKDSEETPDTQ